MTYQVTINPGPTYSVEVRSPSSAPTSLTGTDLISPNIVDTPTFNLSLSGAQNFRNAILSGVFHDSRDDAVAWVAAGNTIPVGQVMVAGRLMYERQTGATTIADMAGFVPGDHLVEAEHYAVPIDGDTNSSTKINAMVRWCSDNARPGFFGAGDYLLNALIEIDATSASVAIAVDLTAHRDATFFISGTDNPDGGFRFYKPGTAAYAFMRGFRFVLLADTGQTGPLIEYYFNQGGSQLRSSGLIEDCHGVTQNDTAVNGTPTIAYSTTPFKLHGVCRPVVQFNTWDGPRADPGELTGAEKDAVQFGDDSPAYLTEAALEVTDCYGILVTRNIFGQQAVGIKLITDDRRIEGGNVQFNAIINSKIGIDVYQEEDSPAGVEPGLRIEQGHIVFRDYAVRINDRKRFQIVGNMWYMTNISDEGVAEPTFVQLNRCSEVIITSNTFFAYPEKAGVVGVDLVTKGPPGVGNPQIFVNNNRFDGSFEPAIRNQSASGRLLRGVNEFTGIVTEYSEVDSWDAGQFGTRDMSWGQYTPTVTCVTNCVDGDVTAHVLDYTVHGRNVRVSGYISVNPTATGATEFHLSLPPGFESVFANVGQCSGGVRTHQAAIANSITALQTGGSNLARVRFDAYTASNAEYHFSFDYSRNDA